MTHGLLKTRLLERVGEEAGVLGYYTGYEATAALNWAQRLFVLLSLCIERSGTLTLNPATAWYHVRSAIADWLLPLRFDYAGAKLRPARLSELDALDASWQARPGDPSRYDLLGLDLLAIYRQPPEAASLTVTYAAAPARLVGDGDVPEIPEEYHPVLVDAGVVFLRVKEGGQEFQKVAGLLDPLLQGAGKLGAYVRSRSLDLRYDRLPVELERPDLSRLLKTLFKDETRTKQWLITSDTRPVPVPK